MQLALPRCICSYSELVKGREQTIHFFGGVVVNEPDAEHAAFLFDSKAFREIHGVKISVPGEEAAVAQKLCNLSRVVVANAQRQCRTAFRKPLRIGDAVDFQSWNGLQSSYQLVQERPLVGHGRSLGGT